MRIKKVIYSMICLLLIGLYLSCGESDDGGTSPSRNYDPLVILSFSVVDSSEAPISNINAIPLDASFLLTFNESLGNIDNHVNSLVNQITLTGNEILSLPLKVELTQISNRIKITPTTDLSYGTTYQLIVKEGLTIGNYRVINDITYFITTEKSSDNSLIVIYNNDKIPPDKNNDITIPLQIEFDPSRVTFTLEVSKGATLQDGNNNNLPLNKDRQYTTNNMDFSGNRKHTFKVTAQDGIAITTYTIGVLEQRTDSKEILSFAFLETDNSDLKANIAMDVNTNSRTVTKTVTNVEGITGLIPTIIHSGSNISPASGVAQDFSTNNTYTVTAIDGTTSDYTVTLTRYYEVIFNANEGIILGFGFPHPSVVTEYILYGNKASPPSDPFQEHYGFKGWYDAPSGGNIFDFTTTEITTPTIVYAQWTNKQYQVRFYRGNSLLGTIPVVSLTTIPVPDYPIPSTSGKIYKWYSDSGLIQNYDINAQVTNDLDLYADEITVSFETIIEDGMIPASLSSYGEMSEQIFSRYNTGATVIPRYVKETVSGSGDGSSWGNAANDIQAMIDGITDVDDNKVYVILAASGTYKPSSSYVMKNHVALIGGFTAGSYDRAGETRLDGNNDKPVFYNNNLDRTALLYGLVITNGAGNYGGGMYNAASSPTLINVTFSGNKANYGGGMYNHRSSPTLINVIFSDNKANYDNDSDGGGMHNFNSSFPTLINVTFSGNQASRNGGGMYNNNSSPILINITFSGNNAVYIGGGMWNNGSSPILINVTFSGNAAITYGGGMYNDENSSPTLINVTFSDNKALVVFDDILKGGGIYHSGQGRLTLINTILWNNNKGNIFLQNNTSDTETVNLYYSVLEGGTTPSITANGIRLLNGDTNTHPIEINSKEIIDDDPELGPLADYGGEVNVISINNNSQVKDKGIYVRGVKSETGNPYPEANLYYSTNNTDWYSDPGLTTQESPPSDADDLTATDARGYSRSGRPDIGAYEVDGIEP